MSRALQAVREAAIDGRLQNTIYRQTQLEKLQKVLVENAEVVNRAIRKDSGHSDVEAAVEFTLTLQAIREYYKTLDETEALRLEYALTRSEDAPARQAGIGVVYLAPTNHTLFYSVVATTSAAIAAGNCVVIELGNTVRETPLLLQKLFKIALDPNIIEFVTSRAADEDLGLQHVRVLQNGLSTASNQQPSSLKTYPPLISLPDSRAIAIVDRGVDLSKTAAALVTARFGFGGNSPYAPDAVFVHEYLLKEFLVACVKEMMLLTANLADSRPVDRERANEVERLLETGIKNGELEVTASTNKASVYKVNVRKAEILRTKITGANLVVLGIRSLDDAIALTNQSARSDQLLASYIFAPSGSAKYLSQFVQAQASFVNQVPLELLVGPAAPRFSITDRSLRYPVSLFSTPHVGYTTQTVNSEFVHRSLKDTKWTDITKALKIASAPLTPKVVRAPGGQTGFFEQGILIGLSMFGIPIILTVSALGVFGVRAYANFRRS
ncbi:putative PutA family dehydrogenase [Lophiotrema nucula]|uniref:Putative PutA family dehydrogenase n=1 Tax=Lophiotrema nucula TaxID=690887 RepID=A0A6A5YXN9_9PLEO|nr:putative PutA family dehydrogenase [Lophiotrema nucula]